MSQSEVVTRVHLGLEIWSQPTWVPGDDGKLGTIEPDELPLSPALVEKLNQWAMDYSAAWKGQEPPADDSADLQALHERGISLWKEVVREIGDRFDVHFDSPIHGESYLVHHRAQSSGAT